MAEHQATSQASMGYWPSGQGVIKRAVRRVLVTPFPEAGNLLAAPQTLPQPGYTTPSSLLIHHRVNLINFLRTISWNFPSGSLIKPGHLRERPCQSYSGSDPNPDLPRMWPPADNIGGPLPPPLCHPTSHRFHSQFLSVLSGFRLINISKPHKTEL